MLKFLWIGYLNNSCYRRMDSLVFISGFFLNKFQWDVTVIGNLMCVIDGGDCTGHSETMMIVIDA